MYFRKVGRQKFHNLCPPPHPPFKSCILSLFLPMFTFFEWFGVLFLWMTCFNFPFSSIVTLWQMKRWSELSCALKVYFCFSVVSLLVLVGVTSYSINKQHKSTDIFHGDNFTVSLIQLFGLREYQCASRCSGCLPPSHRCLKLLVVYKSRCFCDVVV